MVKEFTTLERVRMKTPKQKPKTAYNMITLYVRGDRDFANFLKSQAALAGLPLADFMRETIDYAIGNSSSTFFAERGKCINRSGND